MTAESTPLSGVQEMLRALGADDWDVLTDELSEVSISIKGVPCSSRVMRHVLRKNGLREVRWLTEEVLGLDQRPARVDCSLRVAVVGRRQDGAVDGVVTDVATVLVRSGTHWYLTRLDFRCPPDDLLWEARPNLRAPVDYRIAAATTERLAQLEQQAADRLLAAFAIGSGDVHE